MTLPPGLGSQEEERSSCCSLFRRNFGKIFAVSKIPGRCVFPTSPLPPAVSWPHRPRQDVRALPPSVAQGSSLPSMSTSPPVLTVCSERPLVPRVFLVRGGFRT